MHDSSDDGGSIRPICWRRRKLPICLLVEGAMHEGSGDGPEVGYAVRI